MMVFLALVMAAGGLGWSENGNDYSRYLPATASKRDIVLAVTLGAAIPSALLEILGAAVATGVPGATTITGLTQGFPGWFIVPYLIVAMIQLFAINTLDLYSSGVTLQSLVPRLRRLQCVGIDTVICGAFTAYAVFSSRFFTLLTDFLLFIIVWLAPWCAIYLVDSWLRRNRYDHQSLLSERGGRYYRNGGIHWPGVIALASGMVAAALWLNAYPPYVSPLSSRLGGSDFSVFLGLIVGGALYWLLARHEVRTEAVVGYAGPAQAGAAPNGPAAWSRPAQPSRADVLHPAGVQRPAGDQAQQALLACCAAARWAGAVAAGRPFGAIDDVLRSSDAAVSGLTVPDLREALAGSPLIGPRRPRCRALASRRLRAARTAQSRRLAADRPARVVAAEQPGVDPADQATMQALADWNRADEHRFGDTYLVARPAAADPIRRAAAGTARQRPGRRVASGTGRAGTGQPASRPSCWPGDRRLDVWGGIARPRIRLAR